MNILTKIKVVSGWMHDYYNSKNIFKKKNTFLKNALILIQNAPKSRI